MEQGERFLLEGLVLGEGGLLEQSFPSQALARENVKVRDLVLCLLSLMPGEDVAVKGPVLASQATVWGVMSPECGAVHASHAHCVGNEAEEELC